MYIPLRGCCTDSPGSDDLATSHQIFLALTSVFGAAIFVVVALHLTVR